MAPSASTKNAPDLSNLKISTSSQKKGSKKEPVADSWEDDIPSSDEESTEASSSSQTNSQADTSTIPSAPPPTPRSPVEFSTQLPYPFPGTTPLRSPVAAVPDRRPAKSTLVASNIIAASLGVRNKRSDAQKLYDRTEMDNEKKRREAEKKKKEEDEMQKKMVWGDD